MAEQGQQQGGDTGNVPAGESKPEINGQQPPNTQQQNQEPEWLSGRLERAKEQARKEMLAELGVDSADALKTTLQTERDRKDAEKTFEQRFKDRDQAYKTLEQRHTAMREAFNTYLKVEIDGVPKEHQERLNKLLEKVGDDPVLRLEVLQELKPLFGTSQQPPEKRKAEDIDAKKGATGGAESSMRELTPEELDRRFRVRR